MTATTEAVRSRAHPLTPSLWRCVGRCQETSDVTTLALVPEGGVAADFSYGQFNMITAFGVGEAAVSISSEPSRQGEAIEHTIRDVGMVTHALCQLDIGGVVGVRGPFGSGWDIDEDARDTTRPPDYVVVAGGIGLAPLRGAVRDLTERHTRGENRLFVLAGARSPDQIVFAEDLDVWRGSGAHVDISVDAAPAGWKGVVGVVTALLPRADFDPARTRALICGPEVMMRFVVAGLVERGVDPDHIQVSLERNMQCGCGLCGHCQLGPLLLCRDGPVVTYGGTVAQLLRERRR
jgi:anaerobic sulfite reductase subunit B